MPYRPPSAMCTAHELSLHLTACWRIYYRASGEGWVGGVERRWNGEWEGGKQGALMSYGGQEEWEVAKAKKRCKTEGKKDKFVPQTRWAVTSRLIVGSALGHPGFPR